MRKVQYSPSMCFQLFGGISEFGGSGGIGGMLGNLLGGLGGLFGGGSSSSSSSGNNNYTNNTNVPLLTGGVSRNGISIDNGPIVSNPSASSRASSGGLFGLGSGSSSSSSSANSNVNQNTNVAQANPNNMQTTINQTFNPNQNAGLASQSPAFAPANFNPNQPLGPGQMGTLSPSVIPGYVSNSPAPPVAQPLPVAKAGSAPVMPFGGGAFPQPTPSAPQAESGSGSDLSGALAGLLAQNKQNNQEEPAGSTTNYAGAPPIGANAYMPPSAGPSAQAPGQVGFGTPGQIASPSAFPVVPSRPSAMSVWERMSNAKGGGPKETHAESKAKVAPRRAPHKGGIKEDKLIPPPPAKQSYRIDEKGNILPTENLQRQEAREDESLADSNRVTSIKGDNPIKELTDLVADSPERSRQVKSALGKFADDIKESDKDIAEAFKPKRKTAEDYLKHAKERLNQVDSQVSGGGSTPEEIGEIADKARRAVWDKHPGFKEDYEKGKYNVGVSKSRSAKPNAIGMILGIGASALSQQGNPFYRHSSVDRYYDKQAALADRQENQLTATWANNLYNKLNQDAETNARNALIAHRAALGLQYKAAKAQADLAEHSLRLVDNEQRQAENLGRMKALDSFKNKLSAIKAEGSEDRLKVMALRDRLHAGIEQASLGIKDRNSKIYDLGTTLRSMRDAAEADYKQAELDLGIPDARLEQLEAQSDYYQTMDEAARKQQNLPPRVTKSRVDKLNALLNAGMKAEQAEAALQALGE